MPWRFDCLSVCYEATPTPGAAQRRPAAFAQEEQPAGPVPSRLYVAVQPALMHYTRAYPDNNFYPIGASVGYWLQNSKQLALEFNYTARFPADDKEEDIYFRTRYHNEAQAFSLLLRTALIRPNDAGRFGLEAAGGFTYFRTTQRIITVARDPNYFSSDLQDTYDDASLLLGLSPTYQLSPRWQLTSDLRFQLSLLNLLLHSPLAIGSGAALGTRFYF